MEMLQIAKFDIYKQELLHDSNDLHQLQLYLDCSVRSGDTVLFLGAGDIYFIAQRILSM